MKEETASSDTRPCKLGLALSGGGFRASFFHLGVLKRLAEMGLLQQVNVLSTASGGSIVAGLYFLHLKHAVETGQPLTREGFKKIVADVEEELREGILHDPRGRLFFNLYERNLPSIRMAEDSDGVVVSDPSDRSDLSDEPDCCKHYP